jgi:hypothetical protein
MCHFVLEENEQMVQTSTKDTPKDKAKLAINLCKKEVEEKQKLYSCKKLNACRSYCVHSFFFTLSCLFHYLLYGLAISFTCAGV